MYDPSVGRFIGVDRKSTLFEEWISYTYAANNLILNIDFNKENPEKGDPNNEEETKEYSYLILNGHLPLGNKITRQIDELKSLYAKGMKFGLGIQVNKDVDYKILQNFADLVEQELGKKMYGQVEDIVVGVICVPDDISHLFPERPPKIYPNENILELEIAFDYQTIIGSPPEEFLKIFIDSLAERIQLFEMSSNRCFIDGEKFINDIKSITLV